MPHSSDLMSLLLKSMQTTLLALGELKGEMRGNREAMLTRTGDMMQRFDQRIEDLGTRFDERIDRSETEIFARFTRTDQTIAAHDTRIRAIEQRPVTAAADEAWWRRLALAVLKHIPMGHAMALAAALILVVFGVMSPGDLGDIIDAVKAAILKKLGA